MKRKIHREFVIVALTTILLTTGLITAVFYDFFRKEILNELKICAEVLQNAGIDSPERRAEMGGAGLNQVRISLIDKQGMVFYDNDVDIGGMDNHKERPEVSDARREGSGQSIRRSDTLDQSAFYYAVLLKDGTILRVAKEASSIWRIFRSAFPVIFLMGVMVFLFCMLLSGRATKMLVAPVEYLADHLDECTEPPVYREMMPFVDRIRRQHEDILKNARLRQEFTANVSHELKTPLAAISGYAELIEHEMASQEDVPRFAGEIHRNASRLLAMINDIIRLSELDVMEADAMVFTQVPLYQMAKACVEMLQVSAGKHQVTLSIRGVPCSILGNREMVEEVLYNLCDNGIRYNAAGGNVAVIVEPEGDKVRLTVEDTGIGIPKAYQERVFERFYRVDKSRSKATGGTGLGLAIVKHIAAQHHAELLLQSEPGCGTRISILFDRANAPDPDRDRKGAALPK